MLRVSMLPRCRAARGRSLLQVGLLSTAALGEPSARQESQMRGAFMGCLVADALSLATHYEYDAGKIREFYGAIDKYYAPGEKTGGITHGIGWGGRNFHSGNGNGPPKAAGETTDYGDYNFLIAEHLAETADQPRRINVDELLPRWQEELNENWRSWICTMTRTTFEQVSRGYKTAQLGGNSNAMSLRHSAGLAYYADEEDLAFSARAACFTHRESSALQGAEFFARVSHRIIHKNLTPTAAIKEVALESPAFVQSKVKQALEKVAESTDPASALSSEDFVDDLALTSMARLWDVGKSEPIKVGKASPTEGTLPGAVYFIVKYENDFFAAARANAEVGGDSASRAVAIGSVLGAYLGLEAIPAHLGQGNFVEWDRAQALLDKMPLLLRKPPSSSSPIADYSDL